MLRNPRVSASLLALAVLTAAPAAYATCTYPHAPSQIPDGNTATLDEMLAAKKAVQQYVSEMDAYIKCVDDENPPAPPTAKLTDEQKKQQDANERVRLQKHNAAVTDEETVSGRFNEQIRIFKAKPPKS
jgi:hypothetical protein